MGHGATCGATVTGPGSLVIDSTLEDDLRRAFRYFITGGVRKWMGMKEPRYGEREEEEEAMKMEDAREDEG